MDRINIKEFREEGFLQEANRLFFHPLGLALEVIIDEDGNEKLGELWDYRTDPEGILFQEGVINIEKALNIQKLKESKRASRFKLLGGYIQQV